MSKKFNNYRRSRNISQNKLATLLNLSQSYISKIESFKRIPKIKLFFLIAIKLHICPKLLIDEYVCELCKLKHPELKYCCMEEQSKKEND